MSATSIVLKNNAYFPCCLQNGTDSMHVGFLGSPDGSWEYSQHLSRLSTVGWYKTDRRFNKYDIDLIELANLKVYPRIGTEQVAIADSRQEFDPINVTLLTEYYQRDNRSGEYLRVRVTTFLTQDHLLVEHYNLTEVPVHGASFIFFIGPAHQPGIARYPGSTFNKPFVGWELFEDKEINAVGFDYYCAASDGSGLMWTDLPGMVVPDNWGRGVVFPVVNGDISMVTPTVQETTSFTRYSCLVDQKDAGQQAPRDLVRQIYDKTVELGYDGILSEHKKYWADYHNKSAVRFEKRQDVEYLYNFSRYIIKSNQEKGTGYTPVGIQPYLWQGDQFWDASFSQYVWLGAGNFQESKNLCHFLLGKHEQAKELARHQGYPGARMGWKIRNSGFEANSADNVQYHNNSVAAHSLYLHYTVTGDKELLRKSFALMDDLVTYIVVKMVQEKGDYAIIGECMGPDESFLDLKVNDAWTCAITIRAIEGLLKSAEILGVKPTLDNLSELKGKLRKGLDQNVDAEGVLQSFIGGQIPHWGSLVFAHIPEHPALAATIKKMEENYDPEMDLYNLRSVTRYAEKSFPWTDFWTTRIQAMNNDSTAGDKISRQIKYVNSFGGIAERIFYDGRLLKEFFGTAHAAFSWAIQGCLVNQHSGIMNLFAGIPESWGNVEFDRLVTESGLVVSASRVNSKIRRLEIQTSQNMVLILQCNDPNISGKISLTAGNNIIGNL